MQPGMTVSAVARLHGVSPSLLFGWRRRMAEGGLEAVRADKDVVPASRVRELEAKVRELERRDCQVFRVLPVMRERKDLPMGRRKAPAIPDEMLDQLLCGVSASTAFDQGGLLDQLKKALAERALNAEMDHHLAGEGGAQNSRNGYGRKSVVTDWYCSGGRGFG
jgi:hypothetical protein